MWQKELWDSKTTLILPTYCLEIGFNTFRKISNLLAEAMHHGSIARETQFGLKTPLKRRTKVVLYIKFGWALILRHENHHSNGGQRCFRFLQRCRRSESTWKESIIYFLATHAMELVKPRHSKAAAETIVEDRIPYLNSYDVLIQYQIHWRFQLVF
jgi:ATP-dependent Lhr-like helicase